MIKMKETKIIITIPNDECVTEKYKEEIYQMFKLVCDNIGTNGLPCKRQG